MPETPINPEFPASGSTPWDSKLVAGLTEMVSAINHVLTVLEEVRADQAEADSRPRIGIDTDGTPYIITTPTN